jgi:TPP-dependent indolepyruvate ferredoxin oxidoreductase alpha subunit
MSITLEQAKNMIGYQLHRRGCLDQTFRECLFENLDPVCTLDVRGYINDLDNEWMKKEYQRALDIQGELSIEDIAGALTELAEKASKGYFSGTNFEYQSVVACYVKRLADLACGCRHYESTFKSKLEKITQLAGE